MRIFTRFRRLNWECDLLSNLQVYSWLPLTWLYILRVTHVENQLRQMWAILLYVIRYCFWRCRGCVIRWCVYVGVHGPMTCGWQLRELCYILRRWYRAGRGLGWYCVCMINVVSSLPTCSARMQSIRLPSRQSKYPVAGVCPFAPTDTSSNYRPCYPVEKCSISQLCLKQQFHFQSKWWVNIRVFLDARRKQFVTIYYPLYFIKRECINRDRDWRWVTIVH